jgi:thymidylate synthase (FAD)
MIVNGKAELIRYTQNPEETIALAAKMCYSDDSPANLAKSISEKDPGSFIRALKKMGHLSTFEHASFTFSLTGVSRALLAQITRHRIASFSVRSQRYVSMKDFNYVLPPSIAALGDAAAAKYKRQMDTLSEWYGEWRELLGGNGESANEDARMVLPNACETNMLLTMNARELLHFFALRCCNRAQWELRAIAWQMLKEVLSAAPNVFSDAGPGCLSGKCPEGVKSCGKASEVRKIKESMSGNEDRG